MGSLSADGDGWMDYQFTIVLIPSTIIISHKDVLVSDFDYYLWAPKTRLKERVLDNLNPLKAKSDL